MDPRLLNRLKFHLARVVHGAELADWEAIQHVLGQLEQQRPKPELAALAKQLERAAPALRDWNVPANLSLLSAELARATERASKPEELAPSDEARVALLLHGRALLVIGGDPREAHAERLREAFALSAVHWPRTREQRPDPSALEPWVARDDVAAVVLLIRWIRHALGQVTTLCERHGKPMARVTGGYNTSQIAAALLAQCAKRLGP
ncbi:MAG: hypothetical protein IT454_12665 [Planctomycetes bacterium]|nr:hypothetical protein [Planctomycetota bacterium]